MKLPFTLSTEERSSALWKKLMAHFDERLQTYRKQNDSPKGEIETASLRGRIEELKSIQRLDAEPRDVGEPNDFF